MPERQKYRDVGFTEGQAQLLAHQIDDARERPRRDVILAAALAIFVAAGVGVLSFINNEHRIDDNRDAIAAVQLSRYEASLQSCRETNDRHDQTIAALDQVLSDAIAETPDRAERIRESRASTVLLIDALVPTHNCPKRAREITSVKP